MLKNLIWVTRTGLSSCSCQACSLNSADLDCLFWITGLFLSFLPSSTRPGLATPQEKKSFSSGAGTGGSSIDQHNLSLETLEDKIVNHRQVHWLQVGVRIRTLSYDFFATSLTSL